MTVGLIQTTHFSLPKTCAFGIRLWCLLLLRLRLLLLLLCWLFLRRFLRLLCLTFNTSFGLCGNVAVSQLFKRDSFSCASNILSLSLIAASLYCIFAVVISVQTVTILLKDNHGPRPAYDPSASCSLPSTAETGARASCLSRSSLTVLLRQLFDTLLNVLATVIL